VPVTNISRIFLTLYDDVAGFRFAVVAPAVFMIGANVSCMGPYTFKFLLWVTAAPVAMFPALSRTPTLT